MSSSPQPDRPLPEETSPAQAQTLDQRELQAALQLLVERAQYITGATGATLALPEGEDMVCRASAGVSAPAVGARLQVRSGLTGESISRRQLLRCDNAENDPRVNLETCRAMGIASIVVMPLVRRDGQVCGLFELFSDHPYAFEERDLSALERMADLTLTALDLAESGRKDAVARLIPPDRPVAVEPQRVSEKVPSPGPVPEAIPPKQADPAPADPANVAHPTEPAPTTEAMPEAMRRVQKCSSCGFPISEGRTICLDCEKKDGEKKKEVPDQAVESVRAEFVPAFLDASPPPKESWFSNPVNILAILVVIVGILVAIVVFR